MTAGSAIPRLLVVYTGGTIGMTPSDRGWAPSEAGRRLVETAVEACCDREGVALTFHPVQPQFDSSQARLEYWAALATEVRALAPGHSGIVLIHGTDTLAYAAAMLSFLLIGVAAPLVVTGAQRPLYEAGSDGGANLRDALATVRRLREREACVVFAGLALVAERVVKVATDRDRAFSTPGSPLLGRLAEGAFERQWAPALGPNREPPCLEPGRRPRLDLLPVTPALEPGRLSCLAEAPPDGLLLELYGRGTAPLDDGALLDAVDALVGAGTRILATSQCCRGGLGMTDYPSGRALLERGVIDGRTLSRPAATAKLWCALAEAPRAEPALIARRWRLELDEPAGSEAELGAATQTMEGRE